MAKGLTPESVHLYADRQALDLEVVSTTSLRMTVCGLLVSPGDDEDQTCSRMNVRYLFASSAVSKKTSSTMYCGSSSA